MIRCCTKGHHNGQGVSTCMPNDPIVTVIFWHMSGLTRGLVTFEGLVMRIEHFVGVYPADGAKMQIAWLNGYA